MDAVENYHDNYDFVLKEVLTLYTNKSLEILGIQAKVQELLNTENIEVDIHKTLNDQVLRLDTNDGVNLEWEANVSTADLWRFAAYNIALVRKYKIPFETIILTRKTVRKKTYIGGSIQFRPKVVNLNKRDGQATLKRIREKLDRGEPVNPLEIVYVPLYNNSGVSYEDVYKEIIQLVPRVTPDKYEQERLLLLSALLTNKFVEKNEYRRILGAIKLVLKDNMLFKLIEEEKTREYAIRFLELGVSADIIKKGLDLSDSEFDEIQKELVTVNG